MSHVEAELAKRRELGLDEESEAASATKMASNERLAEVGRKVLEVSLREHLRAAFPHLPEEGIR